MPRSDPPSQVLADLKAGSRRALARMMTLAESHPEAYGAVAGEVQAGQRGAVRIGVTGPGGVGKSTLIDALSTVLRRRGVKIGILATDPTSDRTGGALLGDRVRFSGTEPDEGLFFRSVASRGASGGLSAATYDLLDLLDLFGFETLILEAVGAGQSEIDVGFAADLTLVVFAPGGGDTVQAMKAGLMEVGDIFVINKSELPGADRAADALRCAVEIAEQRSGGSVPEVLLASALEGEGVERLADAIEGRVAELSRAGILERRRQQRARRRVRLLAQRLFEVHLDGLLDQRMGESGELGAASPHKLARELLQHLLLRAPEAGEPHRHE